MVHGLVGLVHALISILFLFPGDNPDSSESEQVDRTQVLEELELTLELPDLDEWKAERAGGQTYRSWQAKRDESEFRVRVILLDRKRFRFSEPTDLTSLIIDNLRDPSRMGRKDRLFRVHQEELVDELVGMALYGSLVHAAFHETTGSDPRVLSNLYFMGTLLPQHGCVIEVEISPRADKKSEKLALEFLRKGVSYSGKTREPRWTDDEVNQRWNEHAPESAKGDNFRKPLRTNHYIILTNSSGGKSFGKKMEENYRKISKVFPFDELPGARLMPVFLFRTPDQYYQFCQSVAGWTPDKAKKSKGHAFRDYYATWYESPNDPVHIHEATHQVFSNRLNLPGGGSWFQEGAAEYMETQKNDRNHVATQVKTGKATSLEQFISMRSLLFSSKVDPRSGNKAHDHYKQAALLMEFFRESPFARKKFAEYIAAMGKVRRNNVAEIEAVWRRLYGVGIEEIEKEFVRYCKKR